MFIKPAVELPPATPLTNQFTAVLLVPETLALNCAACPVCRVALVGVIVTETVGDGVEVAPVTNMVADAVAES